MQRRTAAIGASAQKIAESRKAAGLRRSCRSVLLLSLLLAPAVALSACSSVPDEIDPTQIFDNDEPIPENTRIIPPPDDGDRSYPNLARVPERPAADLSFSERQAFQERLTRDYGSANYSTEPLKPTAGALDLPVSGVNLGPGPAAVVSFAEGSSSLDDKARVALEQVAVAHAALGGAIRVIGHADDAGAQQPLGAFRLSAERAEGVAQGLRRLGVSATAIVTQAVGPDSRRYGVDPFGPRAEIFLDINTANR